MGLVLSRIILSLVQRKKACGILMTGLDGAGKTTILYKQLKLGEAVVSTIPINGFNVETVDYKNISFTVFDCCGQGKLKQLWLNYFTNTSAIIYVVDSTDTQRLVDAKKELELVLESEEVRGCPLEMRECPLLVMANKMDLPQAVSVDHLTDTLGLRQMARPWFVQPTCAINSQGIYEALDWLASQLT